MLKINQEIVITELFRIGMLWRIGYGSLRLLLGVALLKVIGSPIAELVHTLMGHELVEDSSDFLYKIVESFFTQHALHVTYFLAIYFIFWGLVDVILSINLLKGRLWAFPLSLYLISAFIVYEIFRFFHTYSMILFSIILVDIAVFALIYKEYYLIKNNLVPNESNLLL